MNRKLRLIIMLLSAVVTLAHAGVEVLPEGVRFTYTDPNASQVAVAGEFNGWNTTATPMVLEDGIWTVTVKLDAGKHEYKLVVDGQWTADPENPVTSGAYGNSLVEISGTGTEVKQEATGTLHRALPGKGERGPGQAVRTGSSHHGYRFRLENTRQ